MPQRLLNILCRSLSSILVDFCICPVGVYGYANSLPIGACTPLQIELRATIFSH